MALPHLLGNWLLRCITQGEAPVVRLGRLTVESGSNLWQGDVTGNWNVAAAEAVVPFGLGRAGFVAHCVNELQSCLRKTFLVTSSTLNN